MANKAFKSSKKGYTAEKGEKFWKFTCSCGSDMWDNRYKKKTEKSPDLRCKDKKCPKGTNNNGKWLPNSVWLDKDEKEKLNMKGTSNQSNSYTGEDRFSNNIPPSMYAAWAKDIAIYLAGQTGVKSVEDFDTLYKVCLKNMEVTLTGYLNKVSEKKAPEEQKVKDIDDMDDLTKDIGPLEEPEDISNDSVGDLDDPVKEVDSSESSVVDDGFDGLENIDL